MRFQILGRSRSCQFQSSKEIKLQAAIITCFRPSTCHVLVPVPSLNLSDCASKHLDEPCQQGTLHLLLAAILVALYWLVLLLKRERQSFFVSLPCSQPYSLCLQHQHHVLNPLTFL